LSGEKVRPITGKQNTFGYNAFLKAGFPAPYLQSFGNADGTASKQPQEEQQGPSPRRTGINGKAVETIFGSQKQKESYSLEQMTPANQFLNHPSYGRWGCKSNEMGETLMKRLVTVWTERFQRFEGCKQRPVDKKERLVLSFVNTRNGFVR
jgi:hypothetical protein